MKPYGIDHYPRGADIGDCRDFALKSALHSLRGKGGDVRGFRRKAKQRIRRAYKTTERQAGQRLCREEI